MEASRPQGSFGIPEHIRKQMEDTQRAKASKDKEEPPQLPEPEEKSAKAAPVMEPKAAKDSEDTASEADDKEKLLKTIHFWEDQLEIKISPKDIQDYIFKGRLVKEGVFIAAYPDEKTPDSYKDFRVTFQSHTPADLSEIDEKMAAYRERGKFTAEGLENERSLHMLSYVLLSADGRSMGKTPDERYKNVKNFGGMIVSLIAEAWDGFNLLVRYSLREKKLFKKSSTIHT
jgi:hypothetical protein